MFAGYLMFGVTGFGASFVTVPVLSHLLPLPYLLSLSTALDSVSALALAWRTRREVAYRELVRVLPFTLVGSAAGLALLVSLSRSAVLAALGLFVVGNSLYALFGRRNLAPVSPWWAPIAGLAGGLFGSLFGVGGPPQIIYVTRRLGAGPALRPTIAMTVALSVSIRFAVFVAAGLMLRMDVLAAFALLLPIALFALGLGNRIHLAMDRETTLRVVNGFLLVIGATLLWRAIA